MTRQEYPFNLIRDIYGDPANDDTHVNTVYAPYLRQTMELLPEKERIALTRRYKDGATFKDCGYSIGESASSTKQIITKALKRLRRYGHHNYFQLNPATDAPYAPEEIEPYIGELQLSTATENCLIRNGYRTIASVRPLTEEALKSIRNFGERHYQNFIGKLADYEKAHGLTPYPKAPYPNNLIRAIWYANGKPEDTPIDSADVTRLNRLVATLSNQERQFIHLKYKDGHSIQAISEQFGSTPNGVNQIVQGAMKKLNRLSLKQANETVEPLSTTKQELEFSIGFENQADCDKVNHLMDEDKKFIPYKEQVMNMCHDLIDAVGTAGGSYLYDGVKVKITVEYEEENK